MKACNRCDFIVALEAFTKRGNICKECKKIQRIAQRAKSKEHIKQQTADYKAKNKEKIDTWNKNYAREHKEEIAIKSKIFRENNQEKLSERSRDYYDKNKKKIKEARTATLEELRKYNKEYKKENAGKINGHTAKRRATKLNATPTWADLKAIQKFYEACPQGHHVDHIIPMQGKHVCGLHVLENLQYLTAEENLRKGNRFND